MLLQTKDIAADPKYAKIIVFNMTISHLSSLLIFNENGEEEEEEDQSDQTNIMRVLCIFKTWIKYSQKLAFELFKREFLEVFEQNWPKFKSDSIIIALDVIQSLFRSKNINPALSAPYSSHFSIALNTVLAIFNHFEKSDLYNSEEI